MVEQTFHLLQGKRNVIKLYVQFSAQLPNDLKLKILGNLKISGKSQNVIDLAHISSPKTKILSVLIKIS